VENQDQWTLFWCRLLYPIIFEELEGQKVTQYMESLSQREVVFPDGKLKKPSISTLWRKLQAYKQGGVEAFNKKPRKDRGKIRATEMEILDRAIEIKKDLPTRSAKIINLVLEQEYGKTIAKSTLYRHLREHGATKQKLGISKKKVRCRWTRDHSNSLWCGDLEYGPYVLMEGKAYRTYLSAFIDVHSRFVVDARYYLRQNTPILIDNLLRAWSIHGLPRCLYVDNGKVYYSEQLETACFSLEIKLLHCPPREPQPKGCIEKFFQTTQSQFENEVQAGSILTLQQLNQAFSAWLNISYHATKHSETDESPLERFNNGLVAKRQIDINTAIRFFMKKATRIVHCDFSDISLQGRLYKVDPKLRGDKIKVHWDEFGDYKTVLLYSLHDQYLGKGHLHQRERRHQQDNLLPEKKSLKCDVVGLLIDKHQQSIHKQTQGIDYTHAVNPKRWPFLSFISTLAHLMGRSGGASAFSTQEYQELKKIYERFIDINENMLFEAFEDAGQKDIVNITFQLQNLTKRR